MILTTTVVYVSTQIIDEFLGTEGYGLIKRICGFRKKYINELRITISQSIHEFESTHKNTSTGQDFPFYHSEILFEELSKHILFTKNQSPATLTEQFKLNKNVIIPSHEELSEFYSIFTDKITRNSVLKKLFIIENYKARIFEISQVLETVAEKVDTIEKILNPKITRDWFTKQCNDTILDLGSRYTPELNYKLEVSEIFEGLGRTQQFNNLVIEKFDDLITKGRKVIKDEPEFKNKMEVLSEMFNQLVVLIESVNFLGTSELPIQKISDLISIIQETTSETHEFYMGKEREIQKEKNDYQYYHKYGSELRNVRNLDNELRSVSELLDSTTIKLAASPFLVLDGDAGIGKSHLLGDVVSRRIEADFESVFLLGHQFVTDEDPWTQILKRLQIKNINAEQFLTRLNIYAEGTGKRLVIFIDAINEGRGRYFWGNNIHSFVNSFKEYRFCVNYQIL